MTALEGKALLDHGKAIARRYAKRVGTELAEELRAEAVERALGSPPPDGRLEPWLERIYRNLLIDRWRRRQLHTVNLDDEPLPSAHGTPEEEVLRHERRRVVRGSLNELPREARRALLSRFYGELDDHVAATRLGIAPVTVRTRVHRALARLRARLADLGAWCPPLAAKLGAQVATVGLAPVLVAVLLVANAAREPLPPPPPAPAVTSVQQHSRLPVYVPQPRAPEPAAAVRTVARNNRRSVSPAAGAATLPRIAIGYELAEEEVIVGQILHPDALDVFAEPEHLVTPCLVEAPPSFLAQIDKMVEEQL